MRSINSAKLDTEMKRHKVPLSVTNKDLAEHVVAISENSSRLLHEVARLRRDVAILHGRIEPFRNETLPPEPAPLSIATTWRVTEALAMIASTRRIIEGCERELSAVRGHIDAIASDAISRDELKPWIRVRE